MRKIQTDARESSEIKFDVKMGYGYGVNSEGAIVRGEIHPKVDVGQNLTNDIHAEDHRKMHG